MKDTSFWVRAGCLLLAVLMLGSLVGGLVWQLLAY